MDYFSLDFVRYGVYSELSPIELERQSKDKDSQCYSTLNDPEFLVVLCEKWKLDQVTTFEEFMLSWLREYIFSPDIPLEYILENYRRVYSTSKAVRVATRKGRDDFCEYFLKKYSENADLEDNIITGGLQRSELLAKYNDLCHNRVLRKACRLGLKDVVLSCRPALPVFRIIMKQPINPSDQVNIIDIVAITKDLSVLEDPYYLNHPNVTTEWSTDNLLHCKSPWLLEHFKVTIDMLQNVRVVPYSKKLCEYYDKIGYVETKHAHAYDGEGLEWLRSRLNKKGIEVVFEKRTPGMSATGNFSSYRWYEKKKGKLVLNEHLFHYSDTSSIDIIEWFEDNLRNKC